MIKLKRSECAILHLGLKSHWYRMIDSGGEKYRIPQDRYVLLISERVEVVE